MFGALIFCLCCREAGVRIVAKGRLAQGLASLALLGLSFANPAIAAPKANGAPKADVRASSKTKKANKAVGAATLIVGAVVAGAAVYGIAKAAEGDPASP